MLPLAEMTSEISCVLIVVVLVYAAVVAFRARLMTVRIGAMTSMVAAYFGTVESSYIILFVALLAVAILGAIDELAYVIVGKKVRADLSAETPASPPAEKKIEKK